MSHWGDETQWVRPDTRNTDGKTVILSSHMLALLEDSGVAAGLVADGFRLVTVEQLSRQRRARWARWLPWRK